MKNINKLAVQKALKTLKGKRICGLAPTKFLNVLNNSENAKQIVVNIANLWIGKPHIKDVF